MNIEPIVFTVISLISGVIGAGLFVRAKILDTDESLKRHLQEDSAMHTAMVQRLTSVETKIDMLLERHK